MFKEDGSFKEDGRLKPADPKEIAEVRAKGKLFMCIQCGYTQARFNVEFSEQPRCPKCDKSIMVEQVG
jgi:rubrerythrin